MKTPCFVHGVLFGPDNGFNPLSYKEIQNIQCALCRNLIKLGVFALVAGERAEFAVLNVEYFRHEAPRHIHFSKLEVFVATFGTRKF